MARLKNTIHPMVQEKSGKKHGSGWSPAGFERQTMTRMIQMRRTRGVTGEAVLNFQRTAEAGVRGAGERLPHLPVIQRAFGHHDVASVQAQVGGAAAQACDQMGAQAYATGGSVAFRGTPDLHTAAHEAAHVVQQRAGVQLKGGVGRIGDRYERHADAVADAVVQGRSAQDLLDQMGPSASGKSTARGVQCRANAEEPSAGDEATLKDAPQTFSKAQEPSEASGKPDDAPFEVRSVTGRGRAASEEGSEAGKPVQCKKGGKGKGKGDDGSGYSDSVDFVKDVLQYSGDSRSLSYASQYRYEFVASGGGSYRYTLSFNSKNAVSARVLGRAAVARLKRDLGLSKAADIQKVAQLVFDSTEIWKTETPVSHVGLSFDVVTSFHSKHNAKSKGGKQGKLPNASSSLLRGVLTAQVRTALHSFLSRFPAALVSRIGIDGKRGATLAKQIGEFRLLDSQKRHEMVSAFIQGDSSGKVGPLESGVVHTLMGKDDALLKQFNQAGVGKRRDAIIERLVQNLPLKMVQHKGGRPLFGICRAFIQMNNSAISRLSRALRQKLGGLTSNKLPAWVDRQARMTEEYNRTSPKPHTPASKQERQRLVRASKGARAVNHFYFRDTTPAKKGQKKAKRFTYRPVRQVDKDPHNIYFMTNDGKLFSQRKANFERDLKLAAKIKGPDDMKSNGAVEVYNKNNTPKDIIIAGYGQVLLKYQKEFEQGWKTLPSVGLSKTKSHIHGYMRIAAKGSNKFWTFVKNITNAKETARRYFSGLYDIEVLKGCLTTVTSLWNTMQKQAASGKKGGKPKLPKGIPQAVFDEMWAAAQNVQKRPVAGALFAGMQSSIKTMDMIFNPQSMAEARFSALKQYNDKTHTKKAIAADKNSKATLKAYRVERWNGVALVRDSNGTIVRWKRRQAPSGMGVTRRGRLFIKPGTLVFSYEQQPNRGKHTMIKVGLATSDGKDIAPESGWLNVWVKLGNLKLHRPPTSKKSR